MILIDYNNLFLSSIFTQDRNTPLNESVIREIVLSRLLSYKRNFGKEYGDLVICADGYGDCWRKELFPYYKANRKRNREHSDLNWQSIFQLLNKIREEILTYMPYKLIINNRAEADDIISTLVRNVKGPNLIISSDRDFIQLQSCCDDLKQYSPTQKKYLTHKNPRQYLKEKILQGDSTGDGIPNFLSDDDSIVNPDKRQKPLREKTLNEYVDKPLEQFDDRLKKNYVRNKTLIDLIECVPQEIQIGILGDFEQQVPTRKKIMTYFIKYGLKNFLTNLTDF